MSLKETLAADMRSALKSGEEGRLKLSVIRLLRAAIQNAEIEKHAELTDEEIISLIAREMKQRKDVLPDYERAGRKDMSCQLQAEIGILQSYLPRQMTEEELRTLIKEVIHETKAVGQKDMGAVMKIVVPRTKGMADGRLVSQLVKEILQKG